ncbi:histidine phosphatase family protein [Hydrogenobacter hydrogenophilus]|uniref:Probable phosphoglycerate mutase n=1 Tax=Hydrogenobacter hydrogenophilus TaxID=35835 RepID=A0A285NUE7_9AQUI|nr:histidine phosphatase family protein [Hydrogenobacter hydrogenophilus]SNZ13100.1 probable phosphoglycerate mutase [Hydrogenobacter hydrogenophilus]
MKRLFLVRHAQSEYNEKGIFQGRLDSDLTPLGFVQARLTAKELLDKNIQVIYTSPQRRAYKTALTIGDILHLEPIVDERLREMSFGEYEGKPFWSLVEENRELFLNWLANPLKNPLPTQESMEELEKRVKSFLEEIKESPYENILIVAHGGTLHALICLSVGLGLENLWNIHMDNTGITELRIDKNKAQIGYLNRLCHVKKLTP